MMDYHARFYSPAIGKFIQPDTIIPGPTNSQTWNRYSYTLNNPIMYIDPSGHRYCDWDHNLGICSGEDFGLDSDWLPSTWSPGGGGNGTDPYCDLEGVDCSENRKRFTANAASLVLDTVDDAVTAFTGCGIACQAGYGEEVGWGWRIVHGFALFLPGVGGKLIYEPALELIKWGKYELHHLIPKAVSDTAIVKLAAEAGFDFDKYRIPLPNNIEMSDLVDMPWHKGSHPTYSDFVQEELEKLANRAVKEGWTPYDAAVYLEDFVTDLAKLITDSGAGKLP